MRRTILPVAYTTILMLSLASAQQSGPASANRERDGLAAPSGPIIGGVGTTNYIPIWATPSFLRNSAIFQSTAGNVGVGTTTPATKLDVGGDINSSGTYDIGGIPALSVAGYTNLFVGQHAGVNNQTEFNTFVGPYAGLANTSGDQNSFFGKEAGYGNTTGYDNTFVGADAGAANTSGVVDTYVGLGAGYPSNGSYNVFMGFASGANSDGSNNIAIGNYAGANGIGDNNIDIANAGLASENAAIRIGTTGTQTSAYVAGIYGAISSAGVPVYVNANGQLGTQPSSLRFKDDVRDMGDSTNSLMKLRPVTFVYKRDYGDQTQQYGLIAEEVAKVYPELVAYDNDGQPYSVRYQYLSTMLLNEVQKQYRWGEAQAEVIANQKQKIDELEERLSRLESLVGRGVNGASVDAEGHSSGTQ